MGDMLQKLNEIDLDQVPNSININSQKDENRDIAIIGLGLDFPNASNEAEFWDMIRHGQNAVRRIPKNRKNDVKNFFRSIGTGFTNLEFEEGAYLDRIDHFDNSYFRISPNEASLMDPNQRLFLQAAWKAIEDAGYPTQEISGTQTGVYVGYANDGDYRRLIEQFDPSLLSMSVPGNLSSIIASRISYLLNLKGPSMLINTACSSSLVAVHMACQSIRAGECEMAIAGGVQVHILPIRQSKLGIESHDNRTKTFDDLSSGTGAGEGVAALLLKPLSQAIQDGDHIYAVIKGSAINQDGSSVGITAPNASAQEEVIIRAWENSRIDPETIGLIEAHGTGTKLGDPIEIQAIKNAFAKYTNRKQFCAIGSVKSNIGHLDSSAGIAGLIKAALALKYKEIPPSLHFKRPNRSIPFEESAVYVSDEWKPWEQDEFPRRSGVSSFGLSGTNCHVVLEEYQVEASTSVSAKYPIVLSANDESDLLRLILSYGDYLKRNSDVNLADLSYTVCSGRNHYACRIAMVVESVDELSKMLDQCSLSLKSAVDKGMLYGRHALISIDREDRKPEDITQSEQDKLTSETEHWIEELFIERNTSLHALCTLYIQGAAVSWRKLYSSEKRKKLSLPTYPFKRERSWLELEAKAKEKLGDYLEKYLHVRKWHKDDLPYGIHDLMGEGVLVFSDQSMGAQRVIKQLRDQKANVVEVKIGNTYVKESESSYTITGSPNDYANLFADLQGRRMAYILHMLTSSAHAELLSLEHLRIRENLGVYSLLHITRELYRYDSSINWRITVVSNQVYEVTGSESALHPEGASLLGLCNTLRWENLGWEITCLDSDETIEAEQLVQEMFSSKPNAIVSYRAKQRYIEKIHSVSAHNAGDGEGIIRENGIYVITGGLGRIGREIGKYLASNQKVKIMLLNRSTMPERSEWERIVYNNTDIRYVNWIKDVTEMEENGSEVHCLSVDVTDEKELEETLKMIRREHGEINGMVHAAGVGIGMQGSKIKDEDPAIFYEVMKPKTEATWLLDNFTVEDDLDFNVLFSSVITLIGGVASGSYTAANSYLDAFSEYQRKKGRKSVTINWPTWDLDNLIKKSGMDMNKQLFHEIKPEAAIAAFEEALKGTWSRLIIGVVNTNSPVFELGERLPISFAQETLHMALDSHEPIVNDNLKEVVKLTGKEKVAYSETERIIADIWRDVLGFEELNVHDDFFEIGGDSILLTKVHSQIEGEYPGIVKITDFFAYSSISEMSQYVDSLTNVQPSKEQASPPDIRGLLQQVEEGKLSMDEAMKMFNSMEE